MDKEKALEILELLPGATENQIEKRAAVLYKKFRTIESDERGYTINDIDNAYKSLMNIFFVDVEAEKEKESRQRNPNPILKVLKIDEEKVRNSFYYYKWRILGIATLVILTAAIIVSVATNVKPDLKIMIAGDLFIADTETLEQDINYKLGEVRKAQVINTYIPEESETQVNYAMQTKYVVEIAAGNNDIFILDEDKFFILLNQGAIIPIEDVLGDISGFDIDKDKHENFVVEIEQENQGNQKSLGAKLYGIDVSDNDYFGKYGILGERMILCFSITGEFPDNARAFAYEVLK